MHKICKTLIALLLVVLITGCVIEEHATRSYYPYYYDYYVRPIPRPAYAPNPYYIPPRPIYRPKPLPAPGHHRPSHGINYNVRPSAQPRPSAPVAKPVAPQAKPSMPHNNNGRGPSPYSNQKNYR